MVKYIVLDVNEFHLTRVPFRSSFSFIFPKKLDWALGFYLNWVDFFVFFNRLSGDLIPRVGFWKSL